MMRVWTIPVPFEHVAPAVVDALASSLPYAVTLEPEHPAPNLGTYALTWQEPGDVGWVVVRAVDKGRTELRMEGPSPVYHVEHPGQDDVTEVAEMRQRLHDWCAEALQEWLRPWLEGEMAPEKPRRGPTIKTQERARCARKWKETHPEWGRDTVAMKVAEELEEPQVTAETVRNAYRRMREAFPEDGWEWERADRIR